jgi:uncharacterized protein (DUF1800 family)
MPSKAVYQHMKRLAALVALAAIGCAGGTRPAVSVSSLKSELSRDEQIDHALSRLTYGGRPGDAEHVKKIGLERWIALQLSPERLDDHVTDSLLERYSALDAETADLVSTFRQVRQERRQQQRADSMRPDSNAMQLRRVMNSTQSRRNLQQSVPQVATAKLLRAAVSERQLYEQLVDFWENHFSVFSGKGQTRLYIPEYDRDVIRPRAMGKFRDLLGAVAKSPAMLFYLDNAQSVADSGRRTLARGPGVAARRQQVRRGRGLNENYARELMELHTLGVDGGYTQQDVVEVARALTGWSIDPQTGAFVFRPLAHDADEKVILGQKFSGGRGIEEGERVLDILASHPSTARYITRKLAIRFVSDSAPPALVDRCANEFSRTDGDIRLTLRCIVTSPEFFSRAAYRAKVKTPLELVASAFRATSSVPDQTPRSSQIVTRLGQPIFGRQTPDGWPDRAEEWLNAGAMVNRVNFGLQLASGRVPGVRVGRIDQATTAKLSSPEFQRR